MYQHRISILCIISAAMLLAFACKRHIQEDIPYPDKTFSTTQWVNDSLGCLAYRERVHESVFKNESYFVGKSYKKILSLLGKPTNNYREGIESGTIYYTVECTLIPGYHGEPDKYSTSEAKMLLLDMRRDTCINMSIIIP